MGHYKQNRTKRLLAGGARVFGTAVHEVTTPAFAQIAGHAGYDYLMIDREHGAYSVESLREIVRTCRRIDLTPIVRIPDLVPHWVSQTLDLGAEGIMVPRVESRAAVELALSRMKYPPNGERGLAHTVAHSDYQPGLDAQAFVEAANANTMLVIQIESAAAVERVDDIVSVPGVDAVMLGPMDLTLSMGLVGQLNHPDVVAAMQAVIDACNRHGVAGGLHMGNLELLEEWVARGARFITYSGDLGFLEQGARAGIEGLRPREGA